jgi:hypothetical protein
VTTHRYANVGPTIYLSRETDRITDEQVSAMAAAIDKQVRRDLAPVWVTLPRPVRPLAAGTQVPEGDQLLRLVEVSDEAGALGYHFEAPGDFVTGIVAVGAILDAGSQPLSGPYAVSTVVSHEVCEMVVNPWVSGWSDTGKGWMVATEVCDPVQGDYYEINGVAVSDFVTPDFFSPVVSPNDRFDHLGRVSAPFEIAPGGYVLNYEDGQINTYFGTVRPPEWLLKMREHNEAARIRRLKDHRPA